MSLSVGYLYDSEISRKADDFLKTHNGGGEVPVPIEDIIEFDLNIDIVPLDGLQKKFEIDGYLSVDFRSIYVDSFVYNSRDTRYRFTLAHEIGHLVLHREFFGDVQFASVAEWKDFVCGLDPYVYQRLEYQGPEFAGRILVPQINLTEQFMENLTVVQPVIEAATSQRLRREDYMVYAIDAMADYLAPHFNVSAGVVERRIKKEKLDQYIP